MYQAVEITYRRATIDDAPLIYELAYMIWNLHYPGIISQAQIDYMLERNYSEAAVVKQIGEGQQYTIVYGADEPIGYYSVSLREEGHYYLHKFYIQPSQHRQGIGRATFQHIMLSDCKAYSIILLQVNRLNIKAINFYFALGFIIDRAEVFDIGGGYVMDDYVMVLKAKDSIQA